MKKIIMWLVVLIVLVVGVVWLLNRGGNANSSAAPMIPASAPTSQTPVTINTATSPTLGTYLVASNGMTLYQYAKDTSNVSNCSGSCATAWPPYTVVDSAGLLGGTGVNGAIATITRADGTTQVEYNGKPLYFWQGDSKSGDTTGQNVNGFTVVQP
jgi:predicted lipoprotein with Yx(FWY)xxD motif